MKLKKSGYPGSHRLVFSPTTAKKFTAKTLVDKMKQMKDIALKNYVVKARDRQHNIWLRDPFAIKVFTRHMAEQKLEYMHLNPMQPHWCLCMSPSEYRFSSAKFYEENIDEFGLLTHFQKVF